MENPVERPIPFPIIDSHIHLYASNHLKDLAWTSNLPPNHILNRQNSVNEYRAASISHSNLQGFIFVETDRRSSLSEHGWQYVLEEIEFLQRIKTGTPRSGVDEGYISGDRSLLLGAVPWAPLPADPAVFAKYLDRVKGVDNESPSDTTSLIKGFRYLFQDKLAGTQLDPNIVTNLLTLESRGYRTFDLGVDFHSHGASQLHESITMLNSFYDYKSNANPGPRSLNIVMNHLCKPDLSSPPPSHTADPSSASKTSSFEAWSTQIQTLAAFPTTYMKLSGLFSELPSSSSQRTTAELFDIIHPYTRVIFQYFGANRIMFGSDWPVCNAGAEGGVFGGKTGGEGNGGKQKQRQEAWEVWLRVVGEVLEDVGCSEEGKGMVWGGTAREVYGVE